MGKNAEMKRSALTIKIQGRGKLFKIYCEGEIYIYIIYKIYCEGETMKQYKAIFWVIRIK